MTRGIDIELHLECGSPSPESITLSTSPMPLGSSPKSAIFFEFIAENVLYLSVQWLQLVILTIDIFPIALRPTGRRCKELISIN